MIFRPLFNWLAPAFKPLELAVLDAVDQKLSPDARSILDSQRSELNFVQRVMGDSNCYKIRLGRVDPIRTHLFPFDSEARIAWIKFRTVNGNNTFKADLWIVEGKFFSIEFRPQPKAIDLKTADIEIRDIQICCDPMQKENSVSNTWAYIALGANLGKPEETIREAMTLLGSMSEAPMKRSSFWQSTPVDCPLDSPLFVNAVVGILPHTGVTPESLLVRLQELEEYFGRQPKKILNEARPLDLDLITFGNEIRASEKLILPHPRAHERRFVLQPISEIAPDLVLPNQTKTVRELLENLKGDEKLSRLE